MFELFEQRVVYNHEITNFLDTGLICICMVIKPKSNTNILAKEKLPLLQVSRKL